MPSIIKKVYCQRCGKEVPFFGRQKIADGYICTQCKNHLQKYIDARGIPFKQLTVQTINEIDEEIRKLEELERQKAKENIKKAIIYSAIGIVVFLGIGAISSSFDKNDDLVNEEVIEELDEQETAKSGEEPIEESVEEIPKTVYITEIPHHLRIEQMPADLNKEISESIYTWRFDEDNYLQVLAHGDIDPYFSNIDDYFSTICNSIQEQDGITISESRFWQNERDHYIYYGETNIDNKKYYVRGHLYGTQQEIDEIRVFTTDYYDDSVYRNEISRIIMSTYVVEKYKMDDAPPEPKKIYDGLDDMQSFFIVIYENPNEEYIRTLVDKYGFYMKITVSDETYAKWLTITREKFSGDFNSSEAEGIDCVVVFIGSDGKPNSVSYSNGQLNERRISCKYYVYGEKVPVEDVMNDLIEQNNR